MSNLSYLKIVFEKKVAIKVLYRISFYNVYIVFSNFLKQVMKSICQESMQVYKKKWRSFIFSKMKGQYLFAKISKFKTYWDICLNTAKLKWFFHKDYIDLWKKNLFWIHFYICLKVKLCTCCVPCFTKNSHNIKYNLSSLDTSMYNVMSLTSN